jgi:hypothetical protein
MGNNIVTLKANQELLEKIREYYRNDRLLMLVNMFCFAPKKGKYHHGLSKPKGKDTKLLFRAKASFMRRGAGIKLSPFPRI